MSEILPDDFQMTVRVSGPESLLGPLPKEWRVVRLGEVADVRQGRTPKRDLYNDKRGYRIIKVKDFQDGEKIAVTPSGDRSFVSVDLGAPFRVMNEDVLILNSGHSTGVVGQKVGIVPPELEGAFYVAELTAIRARSEASNSFYIFSCLMHPKHRERIRALVKGGHLYAEQLRSLLIPLPPLPEQRAIAHVLRTVQRAKEATDGVIAAFKDLKKSLMQHLFTYGPVSVTERERVAMQESEIGPLPAHWRVVRLGEVVEKTKQIDPYKKPEWSFRYVDVSSVDNELLRITAYQNFMGKEAPSRARKQIAVGDVLFATVRPYLKRIAMVPSELDGHVCSTAFCVLRAKSEINAYYLFFAVSHEPFVQRVAEHQRGSSYPAVTDQDVLREVIPLPPLSEQREIARILQAVDAKIAAEGARRAALEELFKTLLHQLMTGKIRVRGLIPTTVDSAESAATED